MTLSETPVLPGSRPSSWRRWQLATILVAIAAAAACATKVPPPLPSVPKYADFMYPAVPPALQGSPAAASLDRGWRYLQNDDLRNAEREFESALTRDRAFYPAHAAEGYVALARRDYDDALAGFDAALTGNDAYVPALAGRGQVLLAQKREPEALAAFERALAADDSLVDVRRRVEVLRFRNVQELIERARSAASAGRLDDARAAYERAITISPDSAFLYRELGAIEHTQGDGDAALTHLRRAIELDPADATTLVEVGAILEERQDFDGALEQYRKAAALEPSADLTARIAGTTAKAREARLPEPFRAIPQSTQITRGELAALLGIRLEPLLRASATRQVVVTDIRDNWAAAWITLVINAGVMDAFENHTFQPQGRVRRADLAAAVSRVVGLIAQRRPDLREKMRERPRIADMTTTHLSYPAAAVSVSTGVLPLTEGRFQVSRPVSGAEAIDAIGRLQMLADIR